MGATPIGSHWLSDDQPGMSAITQWRECKLTLTTVNSGNQIVS